MKTELSAWTCFCVNECMCVSVLTGRIKSKHIKVCCHPMNMKKKTKTIKAPFLIHCYFLSPPAGSDFYCSVINTFFAKHLLPSKYTPGGFYFTERVLCGGPSWCLWSLSFTVFILSSLLPFFSALPLSAELHWADVVVKGGLFCWGHLCLRWPAPSISLFYFIFSICMSLPSVCVCVCFSGLALSK